MGRVFDKRLVFVLIVLMFLTSGSLFAIKVTAYTNSLVARTISEIPVDYEDSFFNGPATEYNHQLAQASMGLAVSAFRPVFDKDIISPSEHAIQFMLDCGFTDTFRMFYPDLKDAYSWWSYRFKARERNAGWRIDYWLVSKRSEGRVKAAGIDADITGSDHAPVYVDFV